MIVKRHGGFMELIPSPAEKKRAMVGDNVLELLSNLNQRLARIEERLGWEATDKTDFADRLARIERDLLENERLNADLASQGMVHPPDSEAPQSG